MKRLVSDHLVSINQLDGAIQLPAMLNSEIENATRRATDFQPRLLEELVQQGKAEGYNIVRIRIEIEPMTADRGSQEFNKS